jgi:cell division septal protein FtsQ
MPKRLIQSRLRNRPRQHALELRVRSPRIMWFGVRKGLGRVARVLCLLGAVGLLVWGGGYGLKRMFIDNDDFRLQAIELTPNGVIDEMGVVELGGIELNASVFEVATGELQRRLEARADIVSAKVERQLPGTVRVEVKGRKPVAWLECPERNLIGRSQEAGALLDAEGVVFPCSTTLWPQAELLPVVEVAGAGDDPLVPGERIVDPSVRRALRLVLAASNAIPADAAWGVERIRAVNPWSLEMVTSDGEQVTFGLTDHARQVSDLLALKHQIGAQGGRIGTVNLIPVRNIPVTLNTEVPQRAIPVEEPEAPSTSSHPRIEPGGNAAPQSNRLDRDLRAILNRN